MNVDRVRKIDFWFGVPLCFLLSVVSWIIKAIRFRERETAAAKRIVFVKLSELGTIILAYPLLAKIKKEYSSAELFFVTFNKNRDIFKLLGGIIPDKNVLGIREEPLVFIFDTLRAIRRLRREEIDIVFDLEFFSRFSAVFTYLTNARKRIGFYRYTFEGLYRGNLLTHRIQYNPLSHVTKNYLSFSQVVKQIEKSAPQLEEKIDENNIIFPKYVSDNKMRMGLLGKLRNLGVNIDKNRLFLINPGEGMLPLREWPLDNFISLSRRIIENENNYIILIGTEGAVKKADSILKAVINPRCVSLVSQTELDELLELFTVADALISNDCGLAHLAMLTSIKKFIIFGPESPQVFGPQRDNCWTISLNWPCSPCLSALNHRDSLCKDNWCLKNIKVEDVYELVKSQVQF
jgi:ADP-heptose:LPS heptosyltransferase